jgi:hypothetical protein
VSTKVRWTPSSGRHRRGARWDGQARTAKPLRCRDKQQGQRIEFYFDGARALNGLKRAQIAGIDENHLRRGQHDVADVHHLDTKRLLSATVRRDHQTVPNFAASLGARDGDRAGGRHVCTIGSALYANAKRAGTVLSQAATGYDRFPANAVAIQAVIDAWRRE